MAEIKIIDLDVLRPKPVMVKLCDAQFDLSFIPSGAAIEIMKVNDELSEKSIELLEVQKKLVDCKNGERKGLKAKETNLSLDTFDLSAQMCSEILITHDEKFTKDYILGNTNVGMLQKLIEIISGTVNDSISGGVSNSGKAKKETD